MARINTCDTARSMEERETPMPHVAHTRVKRSRGAGGVVVTKTIQVKGHKKRRGSGQMKQLATIGVASHECDSQLRGASHAREETRVKQQSMAARRNIQQATTPQNTTPTSIAAPAGPT